MRTIPQIKESIEQAFMNNENAAKAYGFKEGDEFNAHFSKISIESILFYVFACTCWVLEKFFAEHKDETNERIESILPHRPKWYRDKVLNFMADKTLIPDTDRYDTAGMAEDEIAAAHVIKHAVANESNDASVLTIKVAGENSGVRSKLNNAVAGQLVAYLNEIKDAGVRINLINEVADTFNCEIDIYYNPILIPESVESACRDTITNFIENLPFNGEYTNMGLVDVLQQVEGVKIVEITTTSTIHPTDNITTQINARYVPYAGYFKAGQITLNMKSYE